MGEWIKKNLPCYKCSSSDAMQESEHHYKCFSCGEVFLKKENENKIENNMSLSNNSQKNLVSIGNYYDLKTRAIDKETCRKFGITCNKYTGSFGHGNNLYYLNDEWIYIFNYYKNNKLIKQKIRPVKSKDYIQKGDTSLKEFFGQSIFTPDSTRILVITEGEFDAAVVWQESGFNSVSVPDGVGSLLKCMTLNYDYIKEFKYIIIAMDNDPVALDSVNKVLESDLINKLGPSKIRIAKWPLKDANELLLAGRAPDIKKTLWNAEEFRPKDLYISTDLIEEAVIKPEPGMNTPWPTLTKALQGWPLNSVITIGAADGIGKTEMVDEIKHTFIKNNIPVFSYSAEQEPKEEMLRQAGKILNLPLHIPGVPWDEKLIKKTISEIKEKLIIWSPEKISNVENFINKMEYVSIAYGVKYFIIDHLKAVSAHLTDANNGMEKFLFSLKSFAKMHNVCIILLSHLAKDKKQGRVGKEDESWDKGRVPTKESFYGNSAISAWSSVVLGLSRNRDSDNPDEAVITKVHVLKNRLMGNRSQKTIYLKYIEDTGRLIEIEPIDYNKEE